MKIEVRAILPNKHHIKVYTRLVYCVLLYHEQCLPSEEKKQIFRDHKVNDIKMHVASSTDRSKIETLVGMLPSLDVIAVTSIEAHIDSERAQNLTLR